MRIATVLNVHRDPDCIIDSVEAISRFSSKDVLVVVDGMAWKQFASIELGATKVKGFRHGIPKSPYKNVALGLKLLTENWPDYDWYCYTEYDALFASSRFLKNLEFADEKNVWMLGNDGHVADEAMPVIESMLGEKLRSTYYLLGCCQFFSRKFIDKLKEMDFFNRFLFLTGSFDPGYFPAYSGYDISEHLYPSLCRHFGGNIGVFASWEPPATWHGGFQYFPMRWRPEINPDTEDFPNASIIHPVKDFLHPLRIKHRELRGKHGKEPTCTTTQNPE